MLLSYKRYLMPFVFLALITSFSFGQSQPYLSAPVNGSTWETASPTLYWWYVPAPYSAGPYTYNVQLSTSPTNFTGSNLLADANVTAYGAGSYSVNSSAGLIQGVSYYWRVGINGIYSAVWSFSPYTSGGVVTYTINASSEPHGSISPSGILTLTRGSTQSFSIVPDRGYAVRDLIVDNVSAGALTNYTFTNITANHSIRAEFLPVPVYDTVYVSILGSDADGNGSRLKPYRKIQRGHDRAKPNDFVYVFDGTYQEDVVLTKPIKILGQTGPSTRSFLIRANNISIKNFNVTESSPGPGIQKVGLETYDHLDRLTLENVNAYNNAEMGLLLVNIDTVEVKNCKFYGNHLGGITIRNCNYLSFTNIQLEDNLRGFSAYNSDNITINMLYAEDNGKPPLQYLPDKNGLTFTMCNNISLSAVNSIKNEEQGLKFEDCSLVTLNNVSAVNNKTDGIAFIECDNVIYNTGTASRNGSTVNDNGIEIVWCDNIELNTVAANENANTGILADLNYYGVYKWNPTLPLPVQLTSAYYGQTTNSKFINVSACSNGKHGFYGMHLGYASFTNPDFSNNAFSGFELDAAHNIAITGGKFDGNLDGIVLKPTVNVHPIAPKLSTDEITSFSLTGIGSISNNRSNGINIAPAYGTRVTEPLFYGTFDVYNNGLAGLKIINKVTDPIFSGLYFKSTTSEGVQIADFDAAERVSGVKINDCFFDGYSLQPGRFAIILQYMGLLARNNVDAKNNVFVGAVSNLMVETWIWHKNDHPMLGLVNFTGWSNGAPAINIGSASAYTGSLVTIPVELDITATPLSFTQLMGKITFNEHKLRYKYTTMGTGTIIHDAGWGILFDHSQTDELKFIAFGFNDINTSGILFTVTFEVADAADGSADVQGQAMDWTINGGVAPFVINPGTITYTASSSVSIVKGDATMDFAVDKWDFIAVFFHINGIELTGQAFLNADVNKDNRVDELDAADILAFVDTGVWPSTSAPSLGNLSFAACSVDQQGMLRFPITLYNSANVRSLQVELKYDDSKVDFKNFVQLMQGKGYYLEVNKVSNGLTRLLFTASQSTSGTLVPAELFFTIKNAGSTAGLIKSTYSINGSAEKTGPDYGAVSVTDVEAEEIIPVTFNVEQNYPNPFNPSTTIQYALPQAASVTIRIYDILGSLVNTLVNTEMPAGNHSVVWEGDNSFGSKVVSGAYFYQVVSGSNIVTKKMLLVK